MQAAGSGLEIVKLKKNSMVTRRTIKITYILAKKIRP
jgi:hypothetical protein